MTYQLLTEAEAAQRMGISRRTLASLRLKGKIAYFQGIPVLIDQADIEAFYARRAAELKAKAGPEVGSPEYKAQKRDRIVTRVLQARVKLHYRELRRKQRVDGK